MKMKYYILYNMKVIDFRDGESKDEALEMFKEDLDSNDVFSKEELEEMDIEVQ